jgi:hypothetical protein
MNEICVFYKKLFDTFDLDILSNYYIICEGELSTDIEVDLVTLHNIANTTKKKILLMSDSNPNWAFEDYFLILSKRFDQVYMFSADLMNLWKSHPKIVYFPTFFLTQLHEKNHQTYDKSYRLSFLSNMPRFHRIYFYYKVKDVVTDDDCFRVTQLKEGLWRRDYVVDMKSVLGHYDNAVEKVLPFETHNSFVSNCKLGPHNEVMPNDINTNAHIAYDSYFNVTGESILTAGKVFLTEKTWKAVRSAVIPVFLETNDIFNSFERLGFKFDNAVNIKAVSYLDKIEHIRKCMSELSMQDSKNIYSSELQYIKQNQAMFYDTKLLNIFRNHVRDKLAV